MPTVHVSAETRVSAPSLALILGVSRRRIDQLAAEGVLPKADGKFPLVECVGAYLEARLTLDRLPDAAGEKERLRILTARRQLLEFEVQSVRNVALDPESLLIPLLEVMARNMTALWFDMSNVWPPLLARTYDARYAVQAQLQERLRPLWQKFADEIIDVCPEPHRSAFRAASKAEAEAQEARDAAEAERQARRLPTRGNGSAPLQ